MLTEECYSGRLEPKHPIKNGEIKKWAWALDEEILYIKVYKTTINSINMAKSSVSLRSYLPPHIATLQLLTN